MAAPQSSVSSQNQAVQGPRLASSAGRRTGRVAVHESYDLASDASIKPPASPLRSVTVSIGITSDVVRSNSPLPKIASSTPIVHSSWIQRLKPSSHRCAAKDEPPIFSKDRVVCTHFTKDYSSCGRGLKKSTHHSRSASWPPHSSQSNATRQLALDVEEPACDSPEERYNAAPISSHLNHQYACVLSKNASQSSEAGSRTGSQQDCRKHFCPSGGFVPCSQLFSKGKDHRKPESCSGQQSQDHINEESKSKFLARFEQEKLHSRSQQVKNNNWGNFDGSFPIFSDFVSAPPLPVSVCGAGYSSGASADADADADASYCYAKPLAFGVLNGKEIDQSGFGKFDCRGENGAADVLREKEKLDKFGLILPYKEEAVQNGLSMGFKGAVELNMPQARENFDLFKGAAGKAYLRSGFSTKRPDDPHLSNVNYQRPGARTTEDTTAQNFTPSGIGASRLKKYNLVTSQTPHSGEVGQASRSAVPITSLHEDAARVRIRENSLGDYWNSWVRLLEEQDHGRPINYSGYFKAHLQPDFATGHFYEEFCQQSLTAEQNVNSSKSHKPVNFEKDIGSRDSDEQSLFLSKFSGARIKCRQLIAPSDYLTNFVADCLEVPQEQYLYSNEGASGRVDSQPHSKNSGFHRRFPDDGSSPSGMRSVNLSLDLINNETSRKEWNKQSGWLQRWLSVDKFSSPSGKSLSLYNSQSVGSDQFPKSCFANIQCTVGSSHKDISPRERNLNISDGGSDRYTQASGTHWNCGSAPLTGSRPASQNFAAFRSGYLGSSIEAMAIVGSLPGKRHPTSFQNRGFNCLPCARPKTMGDVTFSDDGKDAGEDEVHFMDINDLNRWQDDISDS